METELDLRELLRIIRKRMWLVISIVVVSCLVTTIVSFYFIQPTFEASTKLIVNKSDDRQGGSQVDINSVNLNIRLIDTYKEIIKTPRIMDKVVEAHPEFKLTAEQLVNKVSVSSVNNTQVMTLVVEDKSYDKAMEIVNAVSNVFQNEIPLIMKVDNVSLLNDAKPLDKPVPVKPNPKLNIVISLVVSLMVAIGIVFLLEYLDDSIKTEDDVAQLLGLPTLTAIPKMKEEDLQSSNLNASQRQVGEISNVAVNR